MSLSLDAEEFLSYLSVERGRAPTSIAAYRRDLLGYEEFLAQRGTELDAVDPALVEDYLAYLRASGLKDASIARALSAIRGLHGFCHLERGAPSDPTADVEGPRAPRGVPKALTEEEVEMLLGAVAGEQAVARRDRAILEVLYASGMRISECAGLDLGSVDEETGLVRVLGKGSKERIVPLGAPALAALDRYLRTARPSLSPERFTSRADAEALWLSSRGRRMSRQAIWTTVRRAALRCGLADRVTPHVLRHSFATHLLDHGADIRVVQELLGHASVVTTQIYTRVSQEQLRRAFDAAHPRAAHVRRVDR